MLSRSFNWSAVGSVAVAILAFLALNLLGQQVLFKYRLDLTDHGLYTLSDGTREILENLNEPIVLKFFVSRSELLQTPGFNAYIGRIEELLFEYSRISNGQIEVRVIDPEPFSEAEDLAVGHGIGRIPTQDGAGAYLGLVGTNSVDDTRTISLFLPEREELLEYDLTRLVYQLDGRERKKVGVISTLPVHGSGGGFSQGSVPPQPPWAFLLRLDSFFDLSLLLPDDEQLPEELDVLVVIHPLRFSDRLQYEIEQFALSGKSVLILVDPFSEVLSSMLGDAPQASLVKTGSHMNTVTKQWGVSLVEDKIVGDLPISARVLEGDGSSGKTIDYPVWMNVQPNQLNPTDPVTAQLGNITMGTAGVLDVQEYSGLVIEPLIQTSTSAKLYDYDEFTSTTNIRQLVEGYQEGGEELVMAVRISGEAKTAFPGGVPETESDNEGQLEPKPQIMEGNINVVMVADTDFLLDRFWVQQEQVLNQTIAVETASNGDLIHNAVDNLLGDDNLIGVRSRGSYFRPFHRFHQIRQAADQEYLDHETQLLEELKRLENLLVDLQPDTQSQGQSRILTDRQREELKQIRERQIEIRERLREVQHNLVKDITQVENRITVINVTAVPLLVILVAIYIGLFGSKRRGRKLLLKVGQTEA